MIGKTEFHTRSPEVSDEYVFVFGRAYGELVPDATVSVENER